jgi:hypothetical protein
MNTVEVNGLVTAAKLSYAIVPIFIAAPEIPNTRMFDAVKSTLTPKTCHIAVKLITCIIVVYCTNITALAIEYTCTVEV